MSLNGRALVIASVIVGFLLIPYLARWQPTLINGFLLLVLIGTVLGHWGVVVAYMAAFGNTVGSDSGGTTKQPGGKVLA